MKNRILVVFTGSMELGGVERSLLGLLEAIDYEKYDVDLFLYGHHGPLFLQLDPRANLLPEVKELAYLRESLKTKIAHGCFWSAWYRILAEVESLFHPVFCDITWGKVVKKCVPPLKKHYNIGLGFFRAFDIIAEKADIDVKIGWVHTDYASAGEDLRELYRDYSRVDYIAAVSQECATTFSNLFPTLKSKLLVIENILCKSLIFLQANEKPSFDWSNNSSIKLLSIGRFSSAKNFDNVPEICRLLRADGLDVTWYLIGYGGEEALIRQKIAESGMEPYVKILGKKENPYPYIQACDVYVQPSRYEGKCVAVREAQMLGKPVIITNYPTSGSQLEDGVDGLIVPLDNEGCAAGIAAALRNPPLLARLAETCRKRDYSNAQELQKLYDLIE